MQHHLRKITLDNGKKNVVEGLQAHVRNKLSENECTGSPQVRQRQGSARIRLSNRAYATAR